MVISITSKALRGLLSARTTRRDAVYDIVSTLQELFDCYYGTGGRSLLGLLLFLLVNLEVTHLVGVLVGGNNTEVLAHLLLLEAVLPLFDLEMLAVNLVKILVGLLFLTEREVLRANLLLGFELSCFHVFELDLAGDQRAALLTLLVIVIQLKESKRI